jgi:hypothetical protein
MMMRRLTGLYYNKPAPWLSMKQLIVGLMKESGEVCLSRWSSHHHHRHPFLKQALG